MRPKLLYLSPKIPRAAGHGTAMRAGLHVRILAELFDLFLVTITEEPDASANDVPDEIRNACRDVVVLPADGHMDGFQRYVRSLRNRQAHVLGRALHPYPYDIRMYDWQTRRAIVERLRGIEFEVIHAFRIHMAPLALTLVRHSGSRRPRLVLDLDVYESEAASRQTQLMRGSAGLQWYWLHRLEAMKYAFWERRYSRIFDQLWVCSDEDRSAMAKRYAAPNICTVRNGFDVPSVLPAPAGDDIFTFLFVGTMSYFANEDGILFFAQEILPRLRRLAAGRFRVMIVGRGPSEEVQRLGQLPDLVVTGAVPEVADYYRMAHAVIAPLRLGGGTRIKLLEAFSYGVPVVATTAGAAGLQVAAGTHVLIADSPDAFAGECVRLMKEMELRSHLAQNAFQFVSSRHSVGAIGSTIRERYLQITRAR